jgi:hypothetical protein
MRGIGSFAARDEVRAQAPLTRHTKQWQREVPISDKIAIGMLTADAVPLPITPFLVLIAIFVASLAVFLWITKTRDPDQ